ncbi:MAG: urate hydroxylase PuuD [Fimbriimonadaceae bacterium]|nr:urate hydroxylase PuuD [Alphaproteobacteria bacterium]
MDWGSAASEWLNLLFRWAHITIGIGWIGASFYFVWLDLAMRKRSKMNKGVSGTVWMVHGGGFYHVEKYAVAPDRLPDDLHWFKWEAYLTWVTGIVLLILQYYLNAKSYLIDPQVFILEPWQAILISVGSLLGGWLIYDLLCRSPLGRNEGLLALVLFVVILAWTAFFSEVFSGRGALIHTGALIGTMMAANVFMVIIPRQEKAARSLLAGEAPDPSHGIIAKQRSVHNNYLTLPVLLMMVSSHYPAFVSHPYKWVIVGLIVIAGASVRHFINGHDGGKHFRQTGWVLLVGFLAIALAFTLTAYRPNTGAGIMISDERAQEIVLLRCAVCHSAAPTHESFDEAPSGIRFDTLEEIIRHTESIRVQAVIGQAMPLGNETAMTAEERQNLGLWLEAH